MGISVPPDDNAGAAAPVVPPAPTQPTTPPVRSLTPVDSMSDAAWAEESKGNIAAWQKAHPPAHATTAADAGKPTLWSQFLDFSKGVGSVLAGDPRATVAAAKAAGEGVVQAVNEGGKLVEHAAVGSVTIAGSASPEKLMASQDAVGDSVANNFLGPQADDPLSNTIRTIAKYGAAYDVLKPLNILADAGPVASFIGRSLIGGASVAAVMDPQEQTMTSLLAKLPVTPQTAGLVELGKAMTVHPDDLELVARVKHGLEGAGLTMAGEAAILAGLRGLGYAKNAIRLKLNGASQEEVAAEVAKAADQQDIVKAQGTGHLDSSSPFVGPKALKGQAALDASGGVTDRIVTPYESGQMQDRRVAAPLGQLGFADRRAPVAPPSGESVPFKAEGQSDGTAVIRRQASNPTDFVPATPLSNIGGRPTSAAIETSKAIDAAAEKYGVTINHSMSGGDQIHINRIEGSPTAPGTAIKKAMAEVHAAADANGTSLSANAYPDGEGADASSLRRQALLRDQMRANGGWESTAPAPGIPGQSEMVRPPNAPENPFRETSHPEVFPVDDPTEAAAMADSANRKAMAEQEAAAPPDPVEYRGVAENLSKATTEAAMNDVLQRAQVSNVTSATTPEQFATNLDALTKEIQSATKGGVVTWDEVYSRAKKLLGTMGEEDLVPAGTEDAMLQKDQQVKLLAVHILKKQMLNDVMDISSRVRARPNDAVLTQSLRDGINNYLEITRLAQAGDTGAGRTLNILGSLKKARFDEAVQTMGAGSATTDVSSAAAAPTLSPADIKTATAAKSDIAAAKSDLAKATKAAADKAKIGPNTKTLVDAADLPKGSPKAPTGPAVSAEGALTTSDFSLARMRAKALQLKKTIERLGEPVDKGGATTLEAANAKADAASMQGEIVKRQADAQRANPLPDVPDISTAEKGGNPVEAMSKWMDQAEAELDRRMAPKPAAGPAAESQTSPVKDYIKAGGAPDTRDMPTSSWSDDEVAAYGRLIEMTGGDLRDTQALADAAHQMTMRTPAKLKDTYAQAWNDAEGVPAKIGAVGKTTLSVIRESFINGIMSHPLTQMVIAQAGIVNTMFDDVARWTEGAVTMNPAMRQAATDRTYGYFRSIGDNLQTAAAALNEGHSVINPLPQTNAIGGTTGQVIRMPTRVLMANHEFQSVANYRSIIREQSMAMGRADGLTGMDLETRVNQDLAASFGHDTGIALHPDAMAEAMKLAFQAPLRPGSWAQKISSLVADGEEARFILPVIKTPVNIFDTSWQYTPGLNWLNKNARTTMLAGGDEAALLHVKSAYAGLLYGAGMYAAMAGNLTGKGPSDPYIRKLWLQNNQPYSFRLGSNGDWHDYSRLEPFATMVGLMADFHETLSEYGTKKHQDLDQMPAAIASATVKNIENKTYYAGLSNFMDMISSGDPEKYNKFFRGIAASSIPYSGTQSSLNTDPYVREIRTGLDAVRAQTPGLSESLDPKYNIFGEPTLKNANYLQRNFAPFLRTQQHSESVEDEMVAIHAALKPQPEQMSVGNSLQTLDLTDAKQWGKPVSPWNRYNQLLAHPKDGSQSFRDELTEFVHSPDWKDLSAGAPGFPGGEQLDAVKQMQHAHEMQAMEDLRDEYPKLDNAIRVLQQTAVGALHGGPTGAAEARQP